MLHCLLAGVPMLQLPLHMEQLLVAERLAATGAALGLLAASKKAVAATDDSVSAGRRATEVVLRDWVVEVSRRPATVSGLPKNSHSTPSARWLNVADHSPMLVE